MTIKEKRDRLIKFCAGRECKKCPLNPLGYCEELNWYNMSDEEINKCCEIAFGYKEIIIPMTNHERIKNMSIEEMAELLARRNFSCMSFCKECENCNQNTFKYPLCIKGIEKWLESEV